MPLSFPSNPSANQTSTQNGRVYRYAGNNVWELAGAGGLSATVTIPGDSSFSQVSLLLHMDGTGSSFTDSSASAKTVTAYGGATQTTAQRMWGSQSATFPSSGYLLVPSHESLNLGTGDFCIEFWAYLTSTARCSFVGKSGDNDAATGWFFEGDSTEFFFCIADSYIVGSANPTGQWFHVAASRTSGTVELYRNGTRIATGAAAGSSSNSYSVSIGSRNISSQGGYSSRTVNGYIDDLRITKGSNRGYTGASIVVPNGPFPDSAGQTISVVFA